MSRLALFRGLPRGSRNNLSVRPPDAGEAGRSEKMLAPSEGVQMAWSGSFEQTPDGVKEESQETTTCPRTEV